MPRIKNGPYLFSMSAGKRPLAMTGPIKADLDRRMLRTLKALARRRGKDHQAVDLPGWVNHDLRRVVRSGHCASRTTSQKQSLHTGHPASRPKHWKSGRSG